MKKKTRNYKPQLEAEKAYRYRLKKRGFVIRNIIIHKSLWPKLKAYIKELREVVR